MKKEVLPRIKLVVQFEYTYAGKENPVANAVLANLRGKFKHAAPDKPKVSTRRLPVII
jgi:hypothetical protein